MVVDAMDPGFGELEQPDLPKLVCEPLTQGIAMVPASPFFCAGPHFAPLLLSEHLQIEAKRPPRL